MSLGTGERTSAMESSLATDEGAMATCRLGWETTVEN